MSLTVAERSVEVDLGDALSLRQLRVSDASALRSVAVANKAYLRRHGEFDDRQFASDDATAKTISAYEGIGLLDFGICLRGQLIGNAILSPTTLNLERMATISYWVAEEYTGRGYATRAAKAMVDCAFANWDSYAVNALVLKQNYASKKVLQKAGLLLVEMDERDSPVELWSVDNPVVPPDHSTADLAR